MNPSPPLTIDELESFDLSTYEKRLEFNAIVFPMLANGWETDDDHRNLAISVDDVFAHLALRIEEIEFKLRILGGYEYWDATITVAAMRYKMFTGRQKYCAAALTIAALRALEAK